MVLLITLIESKIIYLIENSKFFIETFRKGTEVDSFQVYVIHRARWVANDSNGMLKTCRI